MQAETEAYEEELLSEPECVVSSAMRKRFFSEAAPLQSAEFAFFRPRETANYDSYRRAYVMLTE